ATTYLIWQLLSDSATGDNRSSWYTSVALSRARLTWASNTPAIRRSPFSSRLAQAAQVIPLISIVNRLSATSCPPYLTKERKTSIISLIACSPSPERIALLTQRLV